MKVIFRMLLTVAVLLPLVPTLAQDKPNVVYITFEDICPLFGCYGDDYAKTPNLDKLAAEGIRYDRAYSVAPVCSVSRSSVITGMYPFSIGAMNHRSNVKIPEFLKVVPEFFRDAGYYTCNNYKTDYNFRTPAWNDSSKMAHYRNRPNPDQP